MKNTKTVATKSAAAPYAKAVTVHAEPPAGLPDDDRLARESSNLRAIARMLTEEADDRIGDIMGTTLFHGGVLATELRQRGAVIPDDAFEWLLSACNEARAESYDHCAQVLGVAGSIKDSANRIKAVATTTEAG